MASMFFAGIPLEGSGSRPLEADLYDAQQQGIEHENLSATGNLNIGNLIQYDEHVQRHMNGASLGNDQSSLSLPELEKGSHLQAAPDFAGYSPATNANGAEADAAGNNFAAPAAEEAPAASARTASVSSADEATDPQVSAAPAPQAFSDGATGTTVSNNEPSSTSTSTSTTTTTTTTTTYDNGVVNNYTTTTNNTYYDSHDLVQPPGEPSVINTVGDTLTTVVSNVTDPQDGLLHQVVEAAGDTTNTTINNLGDTVTTLPTSSLLEEVTNIAGDVSDTTLNTAGDTINALPTSSLLEEVTNIAGDVSNTTLTTAGDTVTALPATSLLDEVMSTANQTLEVSQPVIDSATTAADPVITPLNDTVSSLTGDRMLLDTNLAMFNNPIPAADNNALINTDMSLLGNSDSTPQAQSGSLVDLDMSTLSAPADGSGAQDGMSLAIAPSELNSVLPVELVPQDTASVPVIDIPLPESQSVPLAAPTQEIAMSGGTEMQDASDSMLDQAVTLAALTDTTQPIAAIDTGVLFTGTSTNVGHSTTTMPAPDFSAGDTLHGSLFGGQA